MGKAEELHHYLTFHDSIDEINTDLERVLAVTSEDLKRVASTYLDPNNLTVVIVRAGPAATSGGGQ
jgi:predicted Zn-dependent peptidase